jgi:hypothetical protein
MPKTLNLLQKLSKVRGYHVAYASFFDSVQDAILFEHLLAASQTSEVISIAESEALEVLGLKRDAFRAARERLTLRGVISYDVKKAGPRTTTTYRVNQELFAKQFSEWVDDDNKVSSEKSEPTPPPPAETVLSEAVNLIGQVFGGQNEPAIATLPAGVKPSPPKKKKTPANAHLVPIAYALIEVTGSDAGVHMGPAMKAAAAIFKSTTVTPTAEIIRQRYGGDPSAWWWSNDWRGKKGDRPTFWSIQESWAKWLSDGSSQATPQSIGANDDDIFKYGLPGL